MPMNQAEIAKNLLLDRSCNNCSNRYVGLGCGGGDYHSAHKKALHYAAWVYYRELPEERICEQWTQ